VAINSSSLNNRFQKSRKRYFYENKKSGYKVLMALVSLVAILVVSGVVINSPLMQVERVLVQGNTRTNHGLILNAANLAIGEQMLDVDTDKVSEQIMDLGTVESVTIDRRLFAGDIVISIEERKPFVSMSTEEGFVLVDSEGIQLEIVETLSELYPHVAGVNSSGEIGKIVGPNLLGFIELWVGLSQNNKVNLKNYMVTQDGSLTAELVNTGTVEFGLGQDIAQKSIDLETILERVDLSCLDSIDVQVPTFPTVKRVESCEFSEEIRDS